jgi:flagellar motility protein MotE (MotC chaperone)
MAQKAAFSLKRKRVTGSRKKLEKKADNTVGKYPGLTEIIEEKMNNKKEKDSAKILERYPDLLEKIEKKMKTEKLHPWVKEFAGIINKGKHTD